MMHNNRRNSHAFPIWGALNPGGGVRWGGVGVVWLGVGWELWDLELGG